MTPLARFSALFLLSVGGALLIAAPLGTYIARIMEGEPGAAPRRGARLERGLYRLAGIDPQSQMGWLAYARALLAFNLTGVLLLYGLQRLQGVLPLNPQRLGGLSSDSAFNTAVSFATNTDWQGYAGESSMSYLTQMAGLGVQNFLSAATGMAVAFALMRGFRRTSSDTIGNFWVDATRATLYVLLPGAVVFAVLLMGQGVVQNFEPARSATLVEELSYAAPVLDGAGNQQRDAAGNLRTEAARTTTQALAMGPVASQESIKLLGTNGGGFFNANSAHPYENPTALTNLLQVFVILLIPFALTASFGRVVGDARQGWTLAASMVVLLAALSYVGFFAEQAGTPLLAVPAAAPVPGVAPDGGNMEGKEVRFGIAGSALFAAATTATSTGAVNSAHDSLTPLGGFVTLFLMQLGELAPGGVGSGLYGIVIFAILGVFIAGLMIGRTPEYLGKKIEAREMKLASLFILTTPILVLAGTALAVASDAGRAGIANPGPHGFSEILYAFSSAGNNNGSAFAGLSANTPFYNVALGVVMWLGRFWPILATLAIAGSLARKQRIPVTEGSMPTHGPLFAALLTATILLIGVLNYVPALALGPVAEELLR